jgi:hypothetical protein
MKLLVMDAFMSRAVGGSVFPGESRRRGVMGAWGVGML